jgi:hypothetical protein
MKYVSLLWPFHALTPIQWVDKGYPNLITDPAPLLSLGGSSKIDSVQNVILIRADLQRGWDNYSLAVNPDVCIFNFYTVPTLIVYSNSVGMWLSHSFPATTMLLGRSSNWTTLLTPICGPLTTFCVITFINVY